MTELLIDYLMQFVGTRYQWNGKTPLTGFDCSGLISEGLIAVGVLHFGEYLSSQQLYDKFKSNGVMANPLALPGDLIFFGSGPKAIVHVGLFIGGGLMLEAGGGGSQVHTMQDAIDHSAYVKVRPSHYRKDFFEVVSMQGLLAAPMHA